MSLQLKGLASLLEIDNLMDESRVLPRVSKEGIIHLHQKMLVPGRYQPRRKFNEETLEELASSIRKDGIIQPIIVRPVSEKKYEIIAGERRWRAAEKVGLHEVPVIIRNISDETALAFSLIENIQREELNPIEEAVALDQLHREFKLSHNEIAERVGRSRPMVWSLMKLLSLPDEVKALLEERLINIGHIKALFSLDAEKLIFYAKKVVEEGLSVRQIEELVQKIKSDRVNDSEKDNARCDEEITLCSRSLTEWNKNLSDKFFSTVHIKLNKKGEGSVTFKVDSIKDMEWLVKNLTRD